MILFINKNIPAAVVERAQKTLSEVKSGTIHPRRLHNGKGVTVPVGRRYRMVKMQDKGWQPMSHEMYNKALKPR